MSNSNNIRLSLEKFNLKTNTVMKKNLKTLMLLCATFLNSFSFAQNLVPNPSFEDTIQCPANPQPTIDYASHWSTYGSSSDYFNSCANNNSFIYGVPSNFSGYQNAMHGIAYAGLITWCDNGITREY